MIARHKPLKVAASKPYPWVRWPRDWLLDTRICDLKPGITSSGPEPRIQQLYRELEQRGFRF
jgi:hypothetical protein